MKKYLVYFTVCAALFAAGCAGFGDENEQLTLPNAPAIEISNIIAEEAGDSITFKIAPAGKAGFYSWVVVQSETADSTISADLILKKLVAGVASGIANYAKTAETLTGAGKLTPFTVYQIYAVAASEDGVVGAVKIASVRTLDDGSKPTPTSVAVADTTVTLTFHEPLQLGAGKVFVSYFAKNTLAEDAEKHLTVKPGFENFNPQDIEIPAEALSIDGNDLIIQLPDAPAGAYASITYNAGAVIDLEGNAVSAFAQKADTLISGAPSRGITVRLASKAWALYSEFEDPETVTTFAEWEELVIPAVPEEGITVAKKVAAAVPTVVYKQPGKTTIVEVTQWGTISGVPAFLLPEEPARGAIVDLVIPAGAYEDVYGNASKDLTIEDNYLYSYGYTLADVVGTYDLAVVSYFDGDLEETGIVIEAKSANSDTLLIKNLLDQGTEIVAVFDPVAGTLTLEDEQLLLEGVDFGANGTGDIYFVNADDSAPVVFNIPTPGTITSPAQWWGYYVDPLGWYDVYSESTWTRVSSPAPVKANKTFMRKSVNLHKTDGKLRKFSK